MKKDILKKAGIMLVLGLVYFLIITYTPFRISCPFRLITGFLCPGCGITTMVMAMSKLDIEAAFYANPFLFLTWPLLLFFVVSTYVFNYKKKKTPKSINIMIVTYLVSFILFGVIRNM